MPPSFMNHVGVQNPTIRCLVVGDQCVGKSQLIMSYATGEFDKNYQASSFDRFTVTVTVEDCPYDLELVDIAGDEAYDHLRQMTYPTTDVIIACYSTVDPASYKNLKDKRIVELKERHPNIPLILVGTKLDLRECGNEDDIVVTMEQGEKLANKINARISHECSSFTREGLKSVFDSAIIEVLDPDVKPSWKTHSFLKLVLCGGRTL